MTVLTVLREFIWNTRRALSMLRLYWGTADCDWSTIAELMRHQIRRIRLHVQKDRISLDTDRIARQMLIAEHLLTRMIDETHWDNALKRYPEYGKYWAQMMTSLRKQDMDMLTSILNKHLQSWWD